jgi:outer membrane immunogenic protein
VLGVEGRAAWTSLKDSNASSVRNLVTGVILPSQFTVSNDFLASATARLGYSLVDRWLFYVKGGGAYPDRVDDWDGRRVGIRAKLVGDAGVRLL